MVENEAREQATTSYVGFQSRNGWHGILGPNLPYDRALKELAAFSRNLAKETNEKAIRGGLKRVAKLLEKFSISPWALAAEVLVGQCREDLEALKATPELLLGLDGFCQIVESTQDTLAR